MESSMFTNVVALKNHKYLCETNSFTSNVDTRGSLIKKLLSFSTKNLFVIPGMPVRINCMYIGPFLFTTTIFLDTIDILQKCQPYCTTLKTPWYHKMCIQWNCCNIEVSLKILHS